MTLGSDPSRPGRAFVRCDAATGTIFFYCESAGVIARIDSVLMTVVQVVNIGEQFRGMRVVGMEICDAGRVGQSPSVLFLSLAGSPHVWVVSVSAGQETPAAILATLYTRIESPVALLSLPHKVLAVGDCDGGLWHLSLFCMDDQDVSNVLERQ